MLGVVVVFGALVAYDSWRTYRDLRDVDAATGRIAVGLRAGQIAEARIAAVDIGRATDDARRRLHRPWWALAAHLPGVGEEVRTARALADAAVDISPTLPTLVDATGTATGVIDAGRVDTATLATLQAPLADADAGFASAARRLDGIDTGSLSGPIGERLARSVQQVRSAAAIIASGRQAADVLPTMLAGTHRYLLVFDNNAEIRTSGGLPGSWALLTAVDGKVSLTTQGSSGAVPIAPEPVLPLSRAEDRLFTALPATDFRDTSFVPDAVRAARLQAALWQSGPGQVDGVPIPLDGVLRLDTVGLSYLLDGTGPLTVRDLRLTSANAVDELLSRVYATYGGRSDAIYRETTRAVFDAITTRPRSLVALISGFARARAEDRFSAVGLTPQVRSALDAAGGAGRLTPAAPDAATAFVTLDDGTAAKMSYYLRRDTEAEVDCPGGTPTLTGFTRLSQTISAARARRLPGYVNGAGLYGVTAGHQQVVVRLYGPPGAVLTEVDVDGRDVTPELTTATYAGRPAVIVPVEVSGPKPVLVAWRFTGGRLGDDVRVWQTPSIVPGPGVVDAVGGGC